MEKQMEIEFGKKNARGGVIFSESEQERFDFWMEDGNVSKNEDGTYSTQDAQWKNNLKDIDALKEYYYNEFLKGTTRYEGGGKLKKKSKISKKYKYFAQHKENKKIYDGWEIIDDVETLKHFAKFDLKDNDLNPSDFSIISAKFLLRKGIDPYDSDNWHKIQYEGGGSLDDKHLVAKGIEYITGSLVQEDTIQFEASQISFKHKNTNTWTSIDKKLIEDTIRMHGKSLKGRFEEGGEAGFNDEGTDMIMYHEKKGNFIVPKGQVYLWLYEGDNVGDKLQSEEYNWVFYPYTSQNLAWQSGYIPPLKKIWTKKFQKDHKGSEKLLGVIKAFLTDEKGKKELFIDMMSVNPTKKKKGIMSYMIKELRDTFNLTQEQVTFSDLTDEGKMFVAKKTYADGGAIDSFVNNMVENQIARRTLMIKDQEKFLSFMNDIQPYIDKKIVRVKVNPINNQEVWVSLQQFDDYADGGDVPHEDKMFQLPLEMVVYVPSTQDVDKVISVDEMDSRVDEVKQYLASKFGGYSSADKLGGFVDSKGSLVNEDVVQVTSFSTKEAYDEHKEELIQQLAKWGKEWGQEAIGFEFEGDLMYVPQQFKNGGEADDLKKKT